MTLNELERRNSRYFAFFFSQFDRFIMPILLTDHSSIKLSRILCLGLMSSDLDIFHHKMLLLITSAMNNLCFKFVLCELFHF